LAFEKVFGGAHGPDQTGRDAITRAFNWLANLARDHSCHQGHIERRLSALPPRAQLELSRQNLSGCNDPGFTARAVHKRMARKFSQWIAGIIALDCASAKKGVFEEALDHARGIYGEKKIAPTSLRVSSTGISDPLLLHCGTTGALAKFARGV
jgi:hypothetical protein